MLFFPPLPAVRRRFLCLAAGAAAALGVAPAPAAPQETAFESNRHFKQQDILAAPVAFNAAWQPVALPQYGRIAGPADREAATAGHRSVRLASPASPHLTYGGIGGESTPLATAAQPLPRKKEILQKMTLANAYFMRQWPDPSQEIMTNKLRPSHIWTRAVYYEGLMALYGLDKQPQYYNYAVDWGRKHQWGVRNGPAGRNADDQCAGQTYLDLYQIDPQPERIRELKAAIDNTVHSEKVDDWSWIDALQMAMPVYARLGVLTKDTAYYGKMYRLYSYAKTRQGGHGLYNPQDSLWWRDKDFVPPYREPNGQGCYWSRGNGWVVAALVRVLDVLPPYAPHRREYEQTYLAMMHALPRLQRPDGYWNVSLHDPTNFGGKELTGTALFTYGMAWGVRHGLLDKRTYVPLIAKAWNAMATECVHSDGRLGYVQGTGKEPKDGQPVSYTSKPDFEDYGLGCFLLAGSEVYKLK